MTAVCPPPPPLSCLWVVSEAGTLHHSYIVLVSPDLPGAAHFPLVFSRIFVGWGDCSVCGGGALQKHTENCRKSAWLRPEAAGFTFSCMFAVILQLVFSRMFDAASLIIFFGRREWLLITEPFLHGNNVSAPPCRKLYTFV